MKAKNKKAILFSFGLLFTLILALLRVFFLVHTRLGELNEESGYSIGSNQLKIYEAIHNSEKSQIYGEEGFSLALQQALYETAAAGKGSRSTGCGTFWDISIWRRNSTLECYPDVEGVKSEIEKSALESLKQKYLPKNPYSDMKGIDKIDYDMFLEQKGSRLIARAYPVNPTIERVICNYGKPPLLVFDAVFKPSAFGYAIPGTTIGGTITIPDLFAEDMTGTCGLYAYRPAFRKELDFNINDFKEASEQAEDFANELVNCESKGEPLDKCVTEKLKAYPKISRNCGSISSSVQRAFLFCYDTGKKAMASDETGKIGLRDLKIKFILSFQN
ncbi:hypothetical protein JW707_03695 [Candidatus Woesearchaeota archaeon]|nr:hypothetical protein [Candidatus Woesearchaeota archaeon]